MSSLREVIEKLNETGRSMLSDVRFGFLNILPTEKGVSSTPLDGWKHRISTA